MPALISDLESDDDNKMPALASDSESDEDIKMQALASDSAAYYLKQKNSSSIQLSTKNSSIQQS